MYVYLVISVNDKRLPGNTKKWALVRSWLIRVRLVHSWADGWMGRVLYVWVGEDGVLRV